MFSKSFSHNLVGKFFTKSTPPSFTETELSLHKQWNLSSDIMTVQKLGNNNDTFLFEFKQVNDKEKVLQQGHYNVNGVIIVIKNLNSLDMIDFTVTTFSVHVFGVPSYLANKDFLPAIEFRVGDYNPVLLQAPSKTRLHISYRVDIDLKYPLRPGFYIQEHQFVQFKYTNLGDFCYNCGMIDHVKSNCDLKYPKERFLYDKSRTHIYGPWLRSFSMNLCPEIALMKFPEIQNCVREFEKTLTYAQFFIEIELNKVFNHKHKVITETLLTHKFRFPCSYLDTETESANLDITTSSKAYEVLQREINEFVEIMPSYVVEYDLTWLKKPELIRDLVEEMKNRRKYEFCCDDKWLTLKLQINENYTLLPVDFETMFLVTEDVQDEQLIERKISDLIKKRVEEKENLLSFSSWEKQIRKGMIEMGFTGMHLIALAKRVKQAIKKAVEMELSSSKCLKPADRSMVLGLERFKVLGPDMDRLNQCMICVAEMFLGEEATIMPCSHVFHSSCIDEWFQVGHKCPLCGFKLLSQN